MKQTPERDAKLIERLGGCAAVARALGYSTARVWNWTQRGIPEFERYKAPMLRPRGRKA